MPDAVQLPMLPPKLPPTTRPPHCGNVCLDDLIGKVIVTDDDHGSALTVQLVMELLPQPLTMLTQLLPVMVESLSVTLFTEPML